ncbi:unnamed protein product, partial [Laminaria digitata]
EDYSLEPRGLAGVSLYVQVAEWEADKRTVTIALVNRQTRGETRDESEERSLYQVRLVVKPGALTRLVPRPSRRSAGDDDGRAADLIYRSAREMASGHTCAADWYPRDGTDEIESVETSWLPEATVPAVSAQGDTAFDPLTSGIDRLSGKWLAEASQEDLVDGLKLLVHCYEAWISAQEERIPGL